MERQRYKVQTKYLIKFQNKQTLILLNMHFIYTLIEQYDTNQFLNSV